MTIRPCIYDMADYFLGLLCSVWRGESTLLWPILGLCH